MLRLRILIPIILIAVSLVIAFFYIKPLYVDMMKTNNKKTQIEDAIQKTEKIDVALSDLRANLDSISDINLDKIDAMLPDKIDEVRYLDMINSLAQSYNLPIEGLKISGLNDAGNTGGNSFTNVGNTIGAKEIEVIDIEFSASSTYQEFKEFLIVLERSLVLLDVNSISLSPSQPGSDSGIEEDFYKYTIKLTTYLKR